MSSTKFTAKSPMTTNDALLQVRELTFKANTSAEAERTFYTPVAYNPAKRLLWLAKNEAPGEEPYCINLLTMECTCPHCQTRIMPVRSKLQGIVILGSIYCKHGGIALMLMADEPELLENLPVRFERVKAQVSRYSQNIPVQSQRQTISAATRNADYGN